MDVRACGNCSHGPMCALAESVDAALDRVKGLIPFDDDEKQASLPGHRWGVFRALAAACAFYQEGTQWSIYALGDPVLDVHG